MSVWASIAGVGMAVGPPLAYADQFISIVRKRDSSGFSTDVCGVLIIANVTRVVYWLGARFQLALLVQSFLMILGQFALLYVCLLYRPKHGDNQAESHTSSSLLPGPGPRSAASARLSRRPFGFWAWSSFGMYIEFTALLVASHCALFLVLHWSDTYVTLLGFLALGLEATLPIPQLLVNYQRKSTAGFRHSVLASWVGGDAIKTLYFFFTPNNTLAFKACAIFQLSIDVVLVAQTYLYREQTAIDLANGNTGGVDGGKGGGGVGVAGAETLLRAAAEEESEVRRARRSGKSGVSRDSDSDSDGEHEERQRR